MALLGFALAAGACGRAPVHTLPRQNGCPDSPAARVTEVEVRHATGFSVEPRGTGRLVTVHQPHAGAAAPVSYLLLPCGTQDPGGAPNAIRVRTPLKRVVTTATPQLAHLEALGLLDRVIGHTNLHYVYSPEVRRLVSEGRISEAGIGPRLEREPLVALAPDAVFTFALGPEELTEQQALETVGLRTIVNADYAELTPLGRSEWLLFTALFFDREAEATRHLRRVEEAYETLASRVAGTSERPTVFASAPYRGVWWMPAGDTHLARLLAAAGARYLWRDHPAAATLALSLEEVLSRAADADVWLNPGLFADAGALRASDERMNEFRAFRSGKIYNFDARTTPEGGNDYWETGLVRPDLVLADLIAIFHPEVLPGHTLLFHRRLPAVAASR